MLNNSFNSNQTKNDIHIENYIAVVIFDAIIVVDNNPCRAQYILGNKNVSM